MDISFEYLQKLLQEVSELREMIKYHELNEDDYDEISYIANKNDTTIGVQEGLSRELSCIRYKLKEKGSIRKDCKYYCKLYKKDGKTVRVESYVKGRIDVVFTAYYSDSRRFLFPFSANGSFYPTYSYVTHYNNGVVDEEYHVNGVQIVYERYISKGDSVEYDCINYVPNGTYPVLSRANGVFVRSPELQYRSNCNSTWRDDESLNSDFRGDNTENI